MEDTSDDAIWSRMLEGDARAFGLIWDRHRDGVFRKLLSMGNAPADAEDLTAVTFLELWRRRRSVRFVDDSLRPWLLVTAHNVARNSARATRRYQSLLARLPAPAPVADPAEVYASRQHDRWSRLKEMLAAAPEADRVLVALTTVDGLTVREAATALGISESAAKMRLSRLRRRLSSAFDPAPALEGELP